MSAKLYRSQTDKMVGGVCAGVGRYLGLDTTLVRLIFILLAMTDGIGVLLYFALWLILPVEGQVEQTSWEENVRAGADEIADRARDLGEDLREAVTSPHPQAAVVVGGGLVILGTVMALRAVGFAWLDWFDVDVLWPILLIVAGVALIVRRPR